MHYLQQVLDERRNSQRGTEGSGRNGLDANPRVRAKKQGIRSHILPDTINNAIFHMFPVVSGLSTQSDSIRTIIKARGLSYPNNTGKTFAVFRVDSIHHLVSFVSMIYPSPDWFVGIASLELCQADCSWLETKVIDLYPWDAGTDKGVTYDVSIAPTQIAH